MQAVDNSHLIGSRSDDESYGPKTTVWNVASDAIRTASGVPVWKFIEYKIKENNSITKAEIVEFLNRINVAGSTMSHSDTIAEIQGQNKFSNNSTLIINLDYISNMEYETKRLFSINITSSLQAKVTYLDQKGQSFFHRFQLSG